ncbi:MAG: glycoside hydrolase family 97 protein [Dysgonamonadaceae bacterium]|jgi:alpha-glucosidase|nr:glycoside hydrolase family 97 protein [Dysgonamonadaceae bacterium]
MKKITEKIIILMLAGVFFACAESPKTTLSSPAGNISVDFVLQDGKPFYSINKNGKTVINPSRLGFILNGNDFLNGGFQIIGTETAEKDETWQQPWGEELDVRNHYKELTVKLQEKNGKKRRFDIVFRAFDDGAGFRYEFPEQDHLKTFEIMDELTEFVLAGDDSIWTQRLFDRDYEQLYRKSKISEITDTVSTPVTVETADGKYIAIHEAALIDYAAMNLSPVTTLSCEKNSFSPQKTKANGNVFKATLTAWSSGIKVYGNTPFKTPWRIVILADNLNELAHSRLMLNLNEPNKIADIQWIQPMKYIGIWWGMHMEKMTWTEGPIHGATTKNMMRYIDFAAKNNMDGVLVEGWNVGWDGYMVGDGTKFKFSMPYPDFDMEKISQYASEKGVSIISHNETAGATSNYEHQLDSAFAFAQKQGIHAIKTGYVSPLLDGKERHSSQYGVRHYRKVVETAAKYRIAIDTHEPIMPTGWQRTWPNLMTQEGVRGQEWDAWSTDGGNPPEHTTILPFTRGLAGPIDFTPGTFNFDNPVVPGTRVQTTIAKQLALYVVIYSPLQMASDLIENYGNRPEFEFIRLVPVDWQKSIVLDGKIGDFVVTARQDKHSQDWYIGAITDENVRDIKIDLSFLDKDKKYTAKIFKDGANADWKTNPYPVEIVEEEVDNHTILDLHLAASGGAAIWVKAKEQVR